MRLVTAPLNLGRQTLWHSLERRVGRRFQVRALTLEDLRGPLLEQALWVFAGALGYPRHASRVTFLADTIRRHSGLAGFRAFGGFNVRGRLFGFSYGYTSQPGLWWRQQVAQPMSDAQRAYWLEDAFELAELHVHPIAQGQHLGGRLHDALLATTTERTALLSVMHRSNRARQLYASRGWQPLITELRFSSEPQTPFSVLGLTIQPQGGTLPPLSRGRHR